MSDAAVERDEAKRAALSPRAQSILVGVTASVGFEGVNVTPEDEVLATGYLAGKIDGPTYTRLAKRLVLDSLGL